METAADPPQPSGTGGSGLLPEEPNVSKFVVLPSPEYVVYTDSKCDAHSSKTNGWGLKTLWIYLRSSSAGSLEILCVI